jgi:uncharacterized protein (UPF0218 family)
MINNYSLITMVQTSLIYIGDLTTQVTILVGACHDLVMVEGRR